MELYQMEFQSEIEAHHAKVLRDIDLSGQFRIADRDGDGRLNAVSQLLCSVSVLCPPCCVGWLAVFPYLWTSTSCDQAEAQTLSDLRGIPFLKEEDYLLLCKELNSENGNLARARARCTLG